MCGLRRCGDSAARSVREALAAARVRRNHDTSKLARVLVGEPHSSSPKEAL